MAEAGAQLKDSSFTTGQGSLPCGPLSNDRRTYEQRAHTPKEVEDLKVSILQRVQDREKDLEVLREEHRNIGRSADSALTDVHNSFTRLTGLIQEKLSEITQRIQTQRESEERRVEQLQDRLQQEIMELKAKYSNLDNLPSNSSPVKINLPPPPHSGARFFPCPLRYFADFPSAVSSLASKLQQTLSDDWPKISQTLPEVLLSKPKPSPRTRTEFLQYSRELTLDADTAHTMLLLSDGNQKVTFVGEHQAYLQTPDRFTHWPQVLSRESLTGRCYFEMEWAGAGVYVAVAYKSIKRQGNSYECVLGSNKKSWALCCTTQKYSFMYNGVRAKVKSRPSHRIGVYLDHAAGSLAFYSVFSDQVTLLHKVLSVFTEPLHVGLRLWDNGNVRLFSSQVQSEFLAFF